MSLFKRIKNRCKDFLANDNDLKVVTYTLIFILIGGWFRLYRIEFGLPHSFHADEPEIAELAIKYTFELKRIIRETTFFELIPISYVYGTLPAYFFTLVTMFYSKTSNLLGMTFDKMSLYVFMRSVNALVSLLLIPVTAYIYTLIHKHASTKSSTLDDDASIPNSHLLEKDYSIGVFLVMFFVALNWKLIVFAHYLNVDIILTLLIALSFAFFGKYLSTKRDSDTKYTVLSALFFGFAVGTKVTALLSLPIFIVAFAYKRELRNMFAFLFIVFGAFMVTNPFSLIFANDFVYRVYELSFKENGLVFDSVDSGIFKYIFSLLFIATPVLVSFFVYGVFDVIKRKISLLDVFLLCNVALYLLFYSTGTRRVDRWMLPILPIVIVYGSYGMHVLFKKTNKAVFFIASAAIFATYMYFPMLLLTQFNRYTPKAEAYLWMRDNIPVSANKLAVTKEGLDPLNKLQGIYVVNYEVYESENAQFGLPPNPEGYDYVILSSKPMSNFKNKEVREEFPFYYDKWMAFENTILDTSKFKLIKSFELSKPNLINLSDVYVYEAVK